MTLWEDLKNALMSIASISGNIEGAGITLAHAKNIGDLKDVSRKEDLEKTSDAAIEDYSFGAGVIPLMIAPPLISTIYSAGYSKIVSRRVASTFQPNLLSPMDYITHKNRFPTDPIDLRFYMSELGLNQDQEDILVDLYKYYPNPQDFVRFGVREVFKPDKVTKYGYDKEFPEEIRSHMHKAGLTDEVMGWFWRAHWELPSFYNIREMKWRGEITDTELDEWLLANDYAPYWREKIKEIIYTPYTRVDVRRMYNSGVIGRDQVKRGYQDIGYDDARAENLTAYTVIDSDTAKDILSTYIKAFKGGIIDESELADKMREMEYSEREIELRIELLSLITVVERPKKGLTLTSVKKLYMKGLIDAWVLEDMLIGLNYSSDAVKYMKLLIISESEPHRAWTAEIKKGYETGILSRDVSVSRLSAIGYSPEAINLTIALIDDKLEGVAV